MIRRPQPSARYAPLSRRKFLGASLGAFCCLSGCESAPGGPAAVVKLAPLSALKAGLNEFPLERVFVIATARDLRALSSVCSHQSCIVRPGPGGEFHCPCHGSSFTPRGDAASPPAVKPLTAFRLSVGEGEWLRVHLGEEVDLDWRLPR